MTDKPSKIIITEDYKRSLTHERPKPETNPPQARKPSNTSTQGDSKSQSQNNSNN